MNNLYKYPKINDDLWFCVSGFAENLFVTPCVVYQHKHNHCQFLNVVRLNTMIDINRIQWIEYNVKQFMKR